MSKQPPSKQTEAIEANSNTRTHTHSQFGGASGNTDAIGKRLNETKRNETNPSERQRQTTSQLLVASCDLRAKHKKRLSLAQLPLYCRAAKSKVERRAAAKRASALNSKLLSQSNSQPGSKALEKERILHKQQVSKHTLFRLAHIQKNIASKSWKADEKEEEEAEKKYKKAIATRAQRLVNKLYTRRRATFIANYHQRSIIKLHSTYIVELASEAEPTQLNTLASSGEQQANKLSSRRHSYIHSWNSNSIPKKNTHTLTQTLTNLQFYIQATSVLQKRVSC